MRIVEITLAFIIILNFLYIVFMYYSYNWDFEIKRFKHLELKELLLEASERYIEINGYELKELGAFYYLNKEIKISLFPIGGNCIYRIMKYNNLSSQVFFCMD